MLIVIDPGHGGRDSGAVGHGLQEKDLNLDIARKARNALNRYAVEVALTRDADTNLELASRADMANKLGADYFLSLHVNAGSGTGFESYVHTTASARALVLQDGIHGQVSSFYSSVGFRDRGKKNANFTVLCLTRMPALLLENLFIDTAGDAAKLADPAFRKQIADAIATGLVKALGLQRVQDQADPVTEAIQALYKAGVIASPDYWIQNAKPGKTADGKFVGMLLQNAAKKIREG